MGMHASDKNQPKCSLFDVSSFTHAYPLSKREKKKNTHPKAMYEHHRPLIGVFEIYLVLKFLIRMGDQVTKKKISRLCRKENPLSWPQLAWFLAAGQHLQKPSWQIAPSSSSLSMHCFKSLGHQHLVVLPKPHQSPWPLSRGPTPRWSTYLLHESWTPYSLKTQIWLFEVFKRFDHLSNKNVF